jgi:dipeptidase D
MDDSVIQGLKPERLWHYFNEISAIPRCSKNEKAVMEYIKKTAESFGLKSKQDKVGNVVVMKPASPGKENSPIVVLQVHTDMVCEKNRDVQHDFSKDGIKFHREGDYIKADGTTLGSDDGIGVAALLALLEDRTLVHGPIEGLFTVDEETGLTGANHVAPGFITGKIMMNLDSEEEGVIYIGCAGGEDTKITIPVKRKKVTGKITMLNIMVRGLRGGHSGVDIHLGRANALKLLGRSLTAIDRKLRMSIISLEGGSKHNAIPREADATIAISTVDEKKVRKIVDDCQAIFINAFKSVDPDVKVLVGEAGKPKANLAGFDDDTKRKVLGVLLSLPHGVIRMSSDIPDLVETSTNVAVMRTARNSVTIITSQRSSIESERDMIAEQVAAIAQLAGANVKISDGYPGWQPNIGSAVLHKAKEVYKNLFGKEPAVKAIHAGLECGIINDRVGGNVDTISFGPTIIGPHSPDEKVEIASVEKFYRFLVEMLKATA